MQQGSTAILRGIAIAAAALLLSGCVLSDSLRQDEIRSVWGRRLPPQPVFFVTDRAPEGESFGLHWDGGAAHCGRATVAIADAVSPVLPDPALAAIPCEGEAAMAGFAAQVAAAAQAKHCRRVLVIVHGYNVGFRSSLLHGAQLAMDAQWPCAALLLEWSSEGKFDRYVADIERSGYAVPLLIATLRALEAAGLEPDLVAHSMGARVALSALGALCQEKRPLLGELILAAPDVGAEPYNDDFGQMLARGGPCVGRTTIYASGNDMALILSESLHGGIPRAGRLPGRALRYTTGPGRVEVVDASLAPGDSSGHAYFVFSYEMLADMMAVLAGTPAAARTSTLDCADWSGGTCAAGTGRYSLKVAAARRPGFGQRLERSLLPLILPVQ